jgi:hypothetical protein
MILYAGLNGLVAVNYFWVMTLAQKFFIKRSRQEQKSMVRYILRSGDSKSLVNAAKNN